MSGPELQTRWRACRTLRPRTRHLAFVYRVARFPLGDSESLKPCPACGKQVGKVIEDKASRFLRAETK